MPGYVNGIPHATSTDRIDLWPTTSRDLAQWVDDNVPRNDDPRLTNARPPTAHTHPISGVTGLQAALNGKTDTTDPRLSDARPPTSHTHDLGDVTGLADRLAALEQPMVTQISTGIYGVGDRHVTSISTGIYQIGA